jgi:hypothetical protein
MPGSHFKSNHKQEHDDAQFGDMQDCLRMRKPLEPEWPDEQARGQVSEHRSQADTPKKRDDCNRSSE